MIIKERLNTERTHLLIFTREIPENALDNDLQYPLEFLQFMTCCRIRMNHISLYTCFKLTYPCVLFRLKCMLLLTSGKLDRKEWTFNHLKDKSSGILLT